IDHVVVVSPDPERTIAALAEHGVVPRQRRRTNQYGPLFTQTFFRLGDPILELIGPDDPAGAEPARFYRIAFTGRDRVHHRRGPRLAPRHGQGGGAAGPAYRHPAPRGRRRGPARVHVTGGSVAGAP